MARPIWSGSISFGLVNVPVKLYSATSPKEVRFHLLHDKDLGRVQQKRVCSIDGQEIPWEHIVKGFQIAKNRYVTVSKDELQALGPRATRSIDIEDFVELGQIDPIFYEHTYYLVPDRGASRPYALLLEAMKKTSRVGIARFVLRTKQYLCAVRPMEKALALSTMLYGDEVVPQKDLDGLPDASSKPREKELGMAEQLVNSLAADFDISKYKDDYRKQVTELLEKKSEGEPIAAEPDEPRGKVVNLMDALQKSLAAAREGGGLRPRQETGNRATARAAHARKPARKAPRAQGKKAS